MKTTSMLEYFRQSNLIEGVKDPRELPKSVTAWKFLLECDTLTKPIVQDVHRVIMQGLLKEHIGDWRPYDVRVSVYECPSWLVIPEMMDDWFNDMKVWQDLDPKECHINFERIHPFVDGNGRVGRMLMWWHEVKLDREPTLITYAGRYEYYQWFHRRSR